MTEHEFNVLAALSAGPRLGRDLRISGVISWGGYAILGRLEDEHFVDRDGSPCGLISSESRGADGKMYSITPAGGTALRRERSRRLARRERATARFAVWRGFVDGASLGPLRRWIGCQWRRLRGAR